MRGKFFKKQKAQTAPRVIPIAKNLEEFKVGEMVNVDINQIMQTFYSGTTYYGTISGKEDGEFIPNTKEKTPEEMLRRFQDDFNWPNLTLEDLSASQPGKIVGREFESADDEFYYAVKFENPRLGETSLIIGAEDLARREYQAKASKSHNPRQNPLKRD